MFGCQLSNLKKGNKFPDRAKMPQRENGKARDICAKAFGVSGRYIQAAKKIIKEYPEIAEQIRNGKKTLQQAINELRKNEPTKQKDNKTILLKAINLTFKKFKIDELENILKYIETI